MSRSIPRTNDILCEGLPPCDQTLLRNRFATAVQTFALVIRSKREELVVTLCVLLVLLLVASSLICFTGHDAHPPSNLSAQPHPLKNDAVPRHNK